MVAPSCSIAMISRSTGRVPMAQPPGSDTLRLAHARQQRRDHPEARPHLGDEVIGRGGVDDIGSRNLHGLAGILAHRRRACRTASRRRRDCSGCAAAAPRRRDAAHSRGSACPRSEGSRSSAASVAFLAPEIGMTPSSGRPPVIRMRSIEPPLHRQAAMPRDHPFLAQNAPLLGRNMVELSPFGRKPYPGPRSSSASEAFRAAANLRLTALEIFPQRLARAVSLARVLGSRACRSSASDKAANDGAAGKALGSRAGRTLARSRQVSQSYRQQQLSSDAATRRPSRIYRTRAISVLRTGDEDHMQNP